MRQLVYGTATFLVFAIAPALLAQSTSTGAQLSGTILDPKGAVVAGANVMLRSNASALERSSVSDSSGVYRFLLVPPGQYTLSVEAPGFGKLTNTGVVLTVGEIANLPITLQLAGVTQELIVTTDAELVETQRTSVGATVDQTRIDNLP